MKKLDFGFEKIIALLVLSLLLLVPGSPLFACVDDDDCPDDLIYCNGNEICEGSVCTHSGNPCDPDGCDETDVAWGGEGACVVDPPITYQFDFDGDEVWDTEWCVEMGETFDAEIWVDDYNLILIGDII